MSLALCGISSFTRLQQSKIVSFILSMTVIEADFWCKGDYGDEDGKCSNKKVRVDINER